MAKKRLENWQSNSFVGQNYDDVFKHYDDLYDNNQIHKSNEPSLLERTETRHANIGTTNQDFISEKDNPFADQFYDENNEDPYNEIRAGRQPGYEQLIKGGDRAIVKAATEISKLAPIIYGVGKAIFEDNNTSTLDDIFNNEGIKALDEMNEKINTEWLPVYMKNSVKNGTLLDNIKSTAFWATEGAEGVGFMAAMFAPGMILDGLSLGSKLIGGLGKISKMTKMVEATEGSVEVLRGLGWSGRAIDSKIAVLANSMIEAGSESKGVHDDLDDVKNQEIQLYQSKGLNQEQATELFNQKHSDWDNQIAEAMKGDFWSQLPMLIGTGSMMQKAIFGKTLDKVETTVERGLLGRVGSMGKQWGKALLSEGFIEEGGQSALEKYYTKKATEGKLNNGLFGNINVGDLTREYINTVSSVDGQKAILLGAVMGGPAMSMEAHREYKKGLKDTNNITNLVNSAIDDHNLIHENDIYQKDEKGKIVFEKNEKGQFTNKKVINRAKALEVAKAYQNTENDDAEYDEAIKSNDIELQKFIQNRSILKMISPAIQNGELGLKILKDQLEQSSKFTDIAERDKSSKDSKNTSKEFIEKVMHKAKHLQEQNEKFKDFSVDIIKLDDKRSTKELNEIYLNHLNSKYIETKSFQYDAENQLKDLIKKRDNVLEEVGLERGLQTEDEVLVKKEETSPLLKQTNDKIRETEKEITKHKKDVHDIWNNKSLINDSFKKYLDLKDNIQKQLSEKNVQDTEDISNNIKSATTVEELDKIKPNEHTAEQFNQKREELESYKTGKREEEVTEKTPETNVRQVLKTDIPEHFDDMGESYRKGIDGNFYTLINRDSNGNILFENNITKERVLAVDKITKQEETTVDDIIEGSANDFKVVDPKIVSDGTVKDDGKSPGSIKGNKQYADYLLESKDKTGDVITFSINTSNFVKDKDSLEAVKLYDKLLKGEKFSATNEELDYLIKHLPIQFNYNNGSSSFSSHGGALNSKLRTSIINALQSGIKLENIQSVVTNQANADFNNQIVNDKPAVNNVLDIVEFNNDVKNLVLYHINTEGKFIVVSEKQEDFQGSHKVNTDLSGNIFVVMSHPKEYKVPVKLNSNKLNITQAEGLALLFKEITKSENTEQRDQVLANLESFDKIKNLLSKEIQLLGNNSNNISIDEMIKLLVLENSSKDSNKSIEIGIDENGNQIVKFNNSEYNLENGIENFVKDLTENKKQNVITIETDATKIGDKGITFKNQAYLKYLLDNKIVSTDINTNPEEGSFKTASSNTEQGSEVYIRSSVESNKPTTNAVFSGKQSFADKIQDKSDLTGIETSNQSEIEAKKTDIEKRRQEELDKYSHAITVKSTTYKIVDDNTGIGDTITEVRVDTKADGSVHVITYFEGQIINREIVKNKERIEDIKSLIGAKGTVSELQKDGTYGDYKLKEDTITEKTENTVSESKKVKEINAKYDAELAALENNSQNNIIKINNKVEEIVNRNEKVKNFKPITKEDRKNVINFDDLFNKIEKEINGKISNDKKESHSLLKSLLKEVHPDKFQNENQKLIAEIFTSAMIIVSKKGDKFKVQELYNLAKVELNKNNSENIRNNENNSVSLQNNVKIENEMDIPNTQANLDYKEAIDKIIDNNKMSVDLQNNIDILAKTTEMKNSEDFKNKSEKYQNQILENIKKANIEMPKLIKNCG